MSRKVYGIIVIILHLSFTSYVPKYGVYKVFSMEIKKMQLEGKLHKF
jgi:hypothetical protein